MDPLSVTASIIAILQLSSKVIGYLNDVKDAPRDRARCAIEATNLHSLLTNLRFRLEDGDASTPWFTAIRSLATYNGPLDQFKQTLELLQARMTGGKGRLRGAIDVLTWKFEKEEIDRLLQSMERLKILVGIALQMDHFKLSQAIKNDTAFVRGLMPTMKTDIDSIKLDMDRAQFDALRAWISPTDFVAQQSDIIRRRHAGTGQWFLDVPEFVDWQSGSIPNGTLFCTGIPGAGKTMLVAVTIDHLSAKVQAPAIGIAWLYCSYKSRVEQTVEALLQVILLQLVRTETPGVVQLAKQLQQTHSSCGSRPSQHEIYKTLEAACAELTTVYIVIDALDECPVDNGSRHQLLAHLNQLQKSADVRVMVTSRRIPDIIEHFQDAARVEIRAHDQDIRQFLTGQLDRLPRCVQRDVELQLMVQEKVAEATDGMFLLARLYVDSLLDKRTKSKMRLALNTLSVGVQTLERAYEEAMKRLRSQLPGDVALAMRALTWIMYAEEAITTTELCNALAVESGTTDLDTENVIDIGDIVSVCVGLVTIDEDSNIIRLVHYTLQEFFRSNRETWDHGGQLEIARTCLTYISYDVFRKGPCMSDTIYEDRLYENPFFGYAARNWGQHAFAVQEEMVDIVASVFADESLANSIAQAAFSSPTSFHGRLSFRYSQNYPSGLTSLHWMAYFGLQSMAGRLLTRTSNSTVHCITQKDSYGRSCLHIAAWRGLESLSRLLLTHGADVDCKTKTTAHMPRFIDGRTPLFYAASYGHADIVRLLVDNGADLNICDRQSWTPIFVASATGHVDAFRILMDNGADLSMTALNAQLQYAQNSFSKFAFNDWNPLAIAAYKGHSGIMSLILSSKRHPPESNVLPASLLFLLVERGRLHTLRLVLSQAKMNLDILDRHSRNLLHVAARNGRYQILLFLESMGLDTLAIDEKGDDLLCYAASSGSTRVLDAALDTNPITSASTRRGWSPLHWACRAGAADVIERLVRAGAKSCEVATLQPQASWRPVDIAMYHGKSYVLQNLSDMCKKALGTTTKETAECFITVVCDGCDHVLYGPRFRCRTCPDFDYCFMCKPLLDHLHEGHGWDYTESPSSIVTHK